MQWIKEVKIEKSIDDLMTSQSNNTWRTDFPDYEVIIASALKKASHACATSEGEKVLKSNVLRKITDSFEEGRGILFGPPELLKLYKDSQICSAYVLQNDDVQDVDTLWDQARLAASEIFTEMVLEVLYESKTADSVQPQTVRNNEQPSYSRLKTSVRTSYC